MLWLCADNSFQGEDHPVAPIPREHCRHRKFFCIQYIYISYIYISYYIIYKELAREHMPAWI